MTSGQRVRLIEDHEGVEAGAEGEVADFQNADSPDTYVRFDGDTPAVGVPESKLKRL